MCVTALRLVHLLRLLAFMFVPKVVAGVVGEWYIGGNILGCCGGVA